MPELPEHIVAQLPRGHRARSVPTGDEHMHVLEWGPRDGRAIVLLHGNPTWGYLWRKVVAELRERAPDYRLIVPDLIGLGLSSKPGMAAHTLVHHGAWLGTMLDTVAPGPLVLAAQDWGGPIGLHAMASRMSRLRGIVLGNTAVGPPAKGFKRTLFHRLSQLPVASDLLFRAAGFPLGVLHLSQGDRSSIKGDVARAYRWPLQRASDRAAPLALARMVPDNADEHVSIPALRISQFTFETAEVPVHLVWGTRDPILGRVVNHLARLRPDAEVTRTEAGHFLQEEVPVPLADANRERREARDLEMRHAFVATAEDDGLRLDQVIPRHVPALSRRKARAVIDAGGVFVDRARVKVASRVVKPNQQIEVNVGSESRVETLAPAIVHTDAHVIVVDKPAGLVTAPTPESDRGDLLDQLTRQFGEVYLVHRIDLPTSGLLVFARTREANKVLGDAFVAHDIDREYRAVVLGDLAAQTIDRPIGDRRAVTHVEPLQKLADATLLRVRLETGRTHQIRIHLAGLGHPVAGDSQHGGERARVFVPKAPRLALHAAVLGFAHPATKERVRFESPLPAELAAWIARLTT